MPTVDYLNYGFLGPVWKCTADLLANEIIHCAWEEADEQDVNLNVSGTTMDMTLALAFREAGPNAIKLRFPGTGSYRLSTHVKKSEIPVDVRDDFGAVMTMGPGGLTTGVGVSVRSDWLGTIADWFAGWKDTLEQQIKERFDEHRSFFSTGRLDSSIALALPNPELACGFA